jgi:mRNA interferase RelE/StbE
MYKVVYAESVLKDVRKLSAEVRERIKTKIKWLAENFDMIKPERLKGELWKDKFKLRVGDYRVIYSVDLEKKIITVHLIGHRSEIYK